MKKQNKFLFFLDPEAEYMEETVREELSKTHKKFALIVADQEKVTVRGDGRGHLLFIIPPKEDKLEQKLREELDKVLKSYSLIRMDEKQITAQKLI